MRAEMWMPLLTPTTPPLTYIQGIELKVVVLDGAANVTARATNLALASRKIYRVTKECMNKVTCTKD